MCPVVNAILMMEKFQEHEHLWSEKRKQTNKQTNKKPASSNMTKHAPNSQFFVQVLVRAL